MAASNVEHLMSANSVPASDRPERRSKTRIVAKRVAKVGLLLVFLVMTFGISPDDEASMRTFDEAGPRWQHDPEYRSLAVEYCILADRALRAKPFLVSGPTLVLTARSLPFAPHRYAVNASSQRHYSRFSGGPLVAYLFFCGEQSVDQFVGILEEIGHTRQPGDADLLRFLEAFHMEYPVCTDAGARQSVATLVRDTRSDEHFRIRKDVGDLLRVHARALARQLAFPQEPDQMSPDQQLAVLLRLDDYVKQHDYQLWRTKQLNDFCCGIWAQVYAPHYHVIIGPVLAIRPVGTWGLVVMLLWTTLHRSRRNRVADPERDGPAALKSELGPSNARRTNQ